MPTVPAALAPLERTRLVDDVTRRLRDLILDGTLAPGRRLLQTTLAEELGVSRTPLREAFRVLQNEGFVEFVDGNKTLAVIDLSTDDLLERYELREVVDGLAARLAAKRGISPAATKRLHSALDVFRGATEPRSLPRRAAAHAEFHANIAELSGNRHVIGQIPMIRFTAQMGTRHVQRLADEARVRTLAKIEEGEGNHRLILDAIAQGDPRKAERAARQHIRSTIDEILRQQVRARSATA